MLSVYSEATTKILAARFTRTKDSVRPVAWLACVTLGNVVRTLVHHPPALDLEQLLAALAGMLRGLFASMQRTQGQAPSNFHRSVTDKSA